MSLQFQHEVLLALRNAFAKEKMRLFFPSAELKRGNFPLIHGQKRRYGVLDKDNNILTPDALLIGRDFFLPIEIKHFSKTPKSQTIKQHKSAASKYLGSIPIYFDSRKRIPTRIKVPPAHFVALITNYRRSGLNSITRLFISIGDLQELADNIPESAGINRGRVHAALIKEREHLRNWIIH